MRGPESKFWQDLRKHPVALPGDVSRVENVADAGTPDLSCAYNGRDYWVELKAQDRKLLLCDCTLEKLFPLFTPAQQPWHARRVRQGSMIFVLVKYTDAIVLWICEAPGLYGCVDVVQKAKGTFDYAMVGELIAEQLGK